MLWDAQNAVRGRVVGYPNYTDEKYLECGIRGGLKVHKIVEKESGDGWLGEDGEEIQPLPLEQNMWINVDKSSSWQRLFGEGRYEIEAPAGYQWCDDHAPVILGGQLMRGNMMTKKVFKICIEILSMLLYALFLHGLV